MKYYIAADGGGTKVQAVLYDEELRMVSAARVSGVNSNFRPVGHIAAEMRRLVRELVPEEVSEVECVCVSVVGDMELLMEALGERCVIKGCQALSLIHI